MSIDDLGICHHFGAGLYAKEMRLQPGMWVGKHRHTYTHLSILAQGRVKVQTDDGVGDGVFRTSTEYKAPACIEIKANVLHAIKALDKTVWYCIHATDETDPERVDQVIIQQGEQ